MLVCGVEVDMEALYQQYKDQKIMMVSEVRRLTGAELKEAKDAVDAFCAQKGEIGTANDGFSSETAANATAAGNAGFGGGQPGMGGQPPMTKEEFSKHPNIASVRSQIKSAGIICYVVAGISLAVSVIMSGIWGVVGVMLDVLLLIGLGLGVQLGRSRVCAIILTVYGAFNTIIVTLQNGTLGGWWVLLAGIYATIYTFKFQSAWEEYQKTGIVKDLSQGKKK